MLTRCCCLNALDLKFRHAKQGNSPLHALRACLLRQIIEVLTDQRALMKALG